MSRRLSSLAPLALAAVVVAPIAVTPALGAETPAGAVDAVLNAMVSGDPEAIGPLVCPAARDAVIAMVDLRPVLGVGPEAAALADALTVTIDGRAVTPVSEDGDRAVVQVSGRLEMAADQAAGRAWVRAGLEVAGQPADDAAVDRALAGFTAALAAGTELTGTVDVAREGGEWRLCEAFGDGEMAIGAGASPGARGTALCDVVTVEELATATGLALVRATPTDAGCQWDTDLGTAGLGAGAATLRMTWIGVELGPIRDLWNIGRDASIAGHPAWATTSGTWVELDGAVLAILPWLDGGLVAVGADPVAVALAAGELVVPRLP